MDETIASTSQSPTRGSEGDLGGGKLMNQIKITGFYNEFGRTAPPYPHAYFIS